MEVSWYGRCFGDYAINVFLYFSLYLCLLGRARILFWKAGRKRECPFRYYLLVCMVSKGYASSTNLVFVFDIRTIEGFSTDAGVTMAQNPMFSIFRHALAGEKIFGGSIVSDETYANVIVQNAIKVTGDTNLATVAAVIIDIWMEVSHHLDESIRACETGGDTSHIDAAVALWIGQDQPEGVFDKGYLLYSIAQEAAQHLGHPETEADTNKELIKQFNEAKKIFLECENGDASVSSRLRFHISTVYQKMAIPLLQNLIYYIVTEVNATERNYVKLYALSIIPQASACNPAGYKYLMEKLVDANVEEKDFNGVFLHLKELMQCLRIDCDTLSLPPSPVFLRAYKYLCLDDGSETLSIAGYEPQVTFFAEVCAQWSKRQFFSQIDVSL